jgi:C1A family cysteine protease
MLNGLELPNVAVLQTLAARQTKACGPAEVAPGTWVRIDCQPYTQVTRATVHTGARKLKLIQARKTIRISPISATLAHHTLNLPTRPGSPTTTGGGAPGGNQPAVKSDSGEQAPDTVDHRTNGMSGPIKNQGYVGSCTAFALSAVMDNLVRRAGKQDVISPLHLWSRYGYPNMGQAVDENINKTVANLEIWPYSGKEACELSRYPGDDCGEAYSVTPGSYRNDNSLLGKQTKAEQGGVHKITGAEKLNTPVNIDEIIQVLASGADMWVAFKIDGNKWTNKAMGPGGVIPDWTAWTGGHALDLAGYRNTPNGRQFLIHNSWGESWGDKGYAWISEKMVKDMMYYAYRIKLDNSDKPAEMTDDDCGPDELVDGVTGQCAPICPDDSRANGGKCG